MKYIVLSLLAFWMLYAGAQQNYDAGLIAPELKSRAAVTIRNESVHLEMRAENDVIEKVKKAITVYNTSGDDYAFIPLYYDKSASIKYAKGVIYDEYGKPIKKISLKDFTDISAADGFSMFVDNRLKYYQFEAVQYPYTIEFEYEIQHKQNLIVPIWNPNFSPAVSVEQSDYTFASAPNVNIRTYTQNLSDDPVVTSTDKLLVRTWSVKNIAAVKEENYTTSFRKQSIKVEIVPQNISYYGRAGAFDSWEQLGKWNYDNLLNGKQDLDERVKLKVLDLVKDCTTDKEKASVLYRYMQEKTRYVSIQIGIGGFEPFPASDVEKYGYGDCKALVNYMQNLLRFADIPSYYCIVHAGNQKESLRPEYPNSRDFNHVILCIPFANDTTWLECTSQNQPFGLLGDFTDDRLVLACLPTGGQVMRTPIYDEKQNKQVRLAKLKLADLSNLEGTIETNFFGTQYDNHLNIFLSNNTDKPKLLAKAYDINNISFSNINYKMVQEDLPYINENIAVHIAGITTKTGNRLMIPSNLFNSYPNIQRNDDRKQPIYINRGFTDEDIVEIELPENINKLMLPVKKEFNCEMGSYQFTAHIEGSKLISNRTLTIKQGTYEPQLYTAFQQFLKSVNQADKGRFTLEILP